MKKLLFLLLTGSFFTLSTTEAQQDSCGLYLTAQDFINGKLSYARYCDQYIPNMKEELLNSRHIVILQSGDTYQIDRTNIYAIRCCEGKIIRIYQDGCYPVMNPGENLLIYKVMQNPTSKGQPARIKFYFSKDAGSDIEDLTLDNLKAALPDNQAFLRALDAQFRSDKDLFAYDNFHKCYKLNRVYGASRQE
jgi:hypothetical protein